MKMLFRVIVLLFIPLTVAFAESGKILVSAALVGKNMDYREYDKAGYFSNSEKSDINEMVGSELRLAYKQNLDVENGYEVGVNFQTIGGTTDYVGSYLLSGVPASGTTNNFIYDVSLDLNYRHTYANTLTLQAGMGFGQRSWRRELRASQIEVYSWYSLRPQLGVFYQQERIKFGLLAEYQYGIKAEMDILANSENGKKTLDLGSANVVEISVPLTYTLNDTFDIFAAYVYEHQEIGASNSIGYIIAGDTYEIYEPKSTAINHYLKLGATLKF